MSSSKDNSFAQILGRHAAGAGDSGSAGSSGSSGSPSPRAQATAGNDETEGKPKKPSGKSTPAKKRTRRKKKSPKNPSDEQSGGRRGGKRSDPDYTHVTVLLHKDLIRRLKMAKVLQERDMSDIVAEALDKELPPE